jgi:hypothetical protein
MISAVKLRSDALASSASCRRTSSGKRRRKKGLVSLDAIAHLLSIADHNPEAMRLRFMGLDVI